MLLLYMAIANFSADSARLTGAIAATGLLDSSALQDGVACPAGVLSLWLLTGQVIRAPRRRQTVSEFPSRIAPRPSVFPVFGAPAPKKSPPYLPSIVPRPPHMRTIEVRTPQTNVTATP